MTSTSMDGKVVLITGAAGGQGRAHAVRMAAEGADVVICDLCEDLPSTPYEGPGEDDLAETVRLVRQHGREPISRVLDVRDFAALQELVADARERFGRIDVLVAQAAICNFGLSWEMSEEQFAETLDINLKGQWLSAKAVIPQMIEQRSGSIVFTSSSAGLKGAPNLSHYSAAKAGLIGLMEAMSRELAEYGIRVNTVHPGNVSTRMVHNAPAYELFAGDPEATSDVVAPLFQQLHQLPVPWLEPEDIAEAVLWLASDRARYVTAVTLPVDAGMVRK